MIALDAGGGTSVGKVYAPAGTPLIEALEGVTAEKEGLLFGAWTLAGRELTESDLVPEDGITVTAKYKAEYTVELRKENARGDAGILENLRSLFAPVFFSCRTVYVYAGVRGEAKTEAICAFFAGRGYRLAFQPNRPNPQAIREIHRGILDFVARFLAAENRLGLRLPITGRDAYAPMRAVCSPKNRGFMAELEELLDEIQVGT